MDAAAARKEGGEGGGNGAGADDRRREEKKGIFFFGFDSTAPTARHRAGCSSPVGLGGRARRCQLYPNGGVWTETLSVVASRVLR